MSLKKKIIQNTPYVIGVVLKGPRPSPGITQHIDFIVSDSFGGEDIRFFTKGSELYIDKNPTQEKFRENPDYFPIEQTRKKPIRINPFQQSIFLDSSDRLFISPTNSPEDEAQRIYIPNPTFQDDSRDTLSQAG